MKRTIFTWAVALLVVAAMAYAGTVVVKPYGIATPKWYGYSSGAKSDYSLSHPTLSADDTAVGAAASQTLTNKTLTSPTISGPTISGTVSSMVLSGPTISGTISGMVLSSPTISGTVTSPTLATPTITQPTITGGGSWASPIISQSISSHTGSYTVAAADAGKILDNTGASGAVTFTLPEASTVLGKSFLVSVAASHTVNVDVDDNDQIIRLTTAAGDKVQNTGTAGSAIGLVAVSDTNWLAPAAPSGTWADADVE